MTEIPALDWLKLAKTTEEVAQLARRITLSDAREQTVVWVPVKAVEARDAVLADKLMPASGKCFWTLISLRNCMCPICEVRRELRGEGELK